MPEQSGNVLSLWSRKKQQRSKGQILSVYTGEEQTPLGGVSIGAGTCPLLESALGVDSILRLVWTLNSPVLEDEHDNVPSVPSRSPSWKTLFPKGEREEVGRRDKRGEPPVC